MLSRLKAKSNTSAVLGCLVAVACLGAVLLVSSVEEEHVTLSQEPAPGASSSEYDRWMAQQLGGILNQEDKHQVFSLLDLQQSADELDQDEAGPDAATKQILNYANKLAKGNGKDKVTALVHGAAKTVNDAELHEGDEEVAKRKQQLHDLQKQIEAAKHTLAHHSGTGHDAHLANTLSRFKHGKNVAGTVQRARNNEQDEEDSIASEEHWLSHAQQKASSAIAHHKARIEMHQARLRRLRHFVNRMNLEREYPTGPTHEHQDDVDFEDHHHRHPRHRSRDRDHRRHADDGDGDSDYEQDEQDYHEHMRVLSPEEQEAASTPQHKWGYATNIGGYTTEAPQELTQNSEMAMRSIDKDMTYVNQIQPPESDEEQASTRARIRKFVQRAVAHRAKRLQAQQHTQAQEEEIIQGTIQKAVVQAVANHLAEQKDKLTPVVTPSFGKDYVTQQSQEASEDAMTSARARGKSYSEVRQAAAKAARRAAEVATRQVAQAAAKTAALRAAQMAANAGKDVYDQKVAAQVAAKAAVRQVIRNDSALRYLNKRRMQVIPGTSSSHWDAARIAAVKAQQDADVAKTATQGFSTEPEGDPYGDKTPTVLVGDKGPMPVQALVGASTQQGAAAAATPKAAPAVARATGEDPIAASTAPITDPELKKEAHSAIQAIANLNHTTATEYPPQSPLAKALSINAAMIRAAAAAKRAKAAAIAAKQAPDTPAGHKIVEQARLIGAEAARDVADARMKVELARSGESPKPIIHEAASQAVQIATPIATEVASQSAALQATIQAVATSKRLMKERNEAIEEASTAADQVVQSADKKMQAALKSKIAKSLKDAVGNAVKGLKAGPITQEAVITAAKKAAAAQARKLEDSVLRHEVKDASDKTATAAAAAAKTAGADSSQVESIRTQAVNTIRLDGEDAMHAGIDEAQDAAVQDAKKQAKSVAKDQDVAKGEAKAAAKAAVADAVDKLSAGNSGVRSSVKEAEQAMSAEQAIKEKGTTAAASYASGTSGKAALMMGESALLKESPETANTPEDEGFLQELMGWV